MGKYLDTSDLGLLTLVVVEVKTGGVDAILQVLVVLIRPKGHKGFTREQGLRF